VNEIRNPSITNKCPRHRPDKLQPKQSAGRLRQRKCRPGNSPGFSHGKVVADKGDRVTGHLAKLEDPGRVKGRARLELVLDEIRTSKNTYKISTEPFVAVAEDTHGRDAAEIGGGAAVGAAIGAIAGGKKGAAIGAVIGGGTGTTAVLVTKGKHLKLEPETKVNFVLKRDVDLPVIRNSNT
jgi:hypothetical protein